MPPSEAWLSYWIVSVIRKMQFVFPVLRRRVTRATPKGQLDPAPRSSSLARGVWSSEKRAVHLRIRNRVGIASDRYW